MASCVTAAAAGAAAAASSVSVSVAVTVAVAVASSVTGATASVVVTGTEVLTGRVADRNGPWLAEALRDVGVDIAAVVVVGDRPEDLRAALAA